MARVSQFNFAECLAFSQGVAQETDVETIRSIIPGCAGVVEVVKDLKWQRLGIDYIARLRRGAEILIDGKARERGCSKYWRKGEPQLALETWSVIPVDGLQGKAGWTLDETKVTDYTLHTFHPDDTCTVFLLPFQLLRMAFVRNYVAWRKHFKVAVQDSGRWKSQCVFVPAGVVLLAIQNEMRQESVRVGVA